MTEPIKVLTLWQPWATLHAAGVKRDETRPKETSHKGTYLVHAAETFPPEARELCEQEPFKSELAKLGYYNWKDLPTAAIVGSVDYEKYGQVCWMLDGYINWQDDTKTRLADLERESPNEVAFGDYTLGRWIWKGKNHQTFKTPIPYKNGQGYYRNFHVEKFAKGKALEALQAIQEIGGELREIASRQIDEIYQQAKEKLGENSAIPKVLEVARLLAPEAKHIGVIGHPAFSFLDMLPILERPLVQEPAPQQVFEFKAPKKLPPIALPSIISKSMTRNQKRKKWSEKGKFSKLKYHSLTNGK